MFPVNYKFVSYKTINISEGDPLTVLVLDEPSNTQYWKVIHSFANFLRGQKIADPSLINCWHISTGFAKSEPFGDLLHDLNPGLFDTDSTDLKIYEIPVSYVEDERPFCVLEYADGKLVENELWK